MTDIPLARPDIRDEDVAAVAAVLRSGRLSLGPALQRFEAAMAAAAGTAGAAAVSSGTAGLQIVLEALGVGPGDEVIVPAFTVAATANAVRRAGATPVFADIDPVTLNMSPDDAAARVTERTRALMPVHVFGRPAAMDRLGALAETLGLKLIEDACEALGSRWRGRRVGSLGDAGVFGFYPNKLITTGEGGAVTSDDTELLQRCRRLANHGRSGVGPVSDATPGMNCRLSDIHAALGASQLDRLGTLVDGRARVAHAYDKRLGSLVGVRTPAPPGPDESIAWFVYVVQLGDRWAGEGRDRVMEGLRRRGIGCAQYFPAVHRLPPYAGVPHGRPLAHAEAAADRCLALPFFPGLADTDIDRVCAALAEELAGA